jgi:hypothetical protein
LPSIRLNCYRQIPQVIALHQGKVIGYNLAMTAAMETELPSLEPMFREFHKAEYKGRVLTDYQFFVGGQVCVDKNFRGLGLLSKLYNASAGLVGPGYELCVTEIAVRTHNDGLEDWNVVAWDIRNR